MIKQLRLEDVWHPRPTIINRRELTKVFPDIVEVDSDGSVTYTQRLYGNLSTPFNLKDFPFDRHVLRIELVSLYPTNKVVFSDKNSLLGENSVRKRGLCVKGRDTTTYGGWTISCRWQDYRNR